MAQNMRNPFRRKAVSSSPLPPKKAEKDKTGEVVQHPKAPEGKVTYRCVENTFIKRSEAPASLLSDREKLKASPNDIVTGAYAGEIEQYMILNDISGSSVSATGSWYLFKTHWQKRS